jgi:hypothetical protein
MLKLNLSVRYLVLRAMRGDPGYSIPAISSAF